ncbi:MAG TPA: hypothetical protein PKW79_00005, partial [Rhabdochlamydiaceae bacterium]|nr:hypothetical protein [Rhabdochlamydiaceae bacterium]
MEDLAPGIQEENALRAGGFNESEIGAWRMETAQKLQNAGFGAPEIDQYFGYKNPDMKPIKNLLQENIKKAQAEAQPQTSPSGSQPKKAMSFMEALEAGWQMSVTGLLKREKKPDVQVAEDAPRFYKIASGVAALAGDLPAMLEGGFTGGIAGGMAGAAVGSAIAPGPGTALGGAVGDVIGTGYGAMALPAAVRKILMDHYEKGDITSFSDFWDRAAGTFIEANKEGFIGAATAGVGGAVGKVAAPVMRPALKTTAQLSAEVATMVSVGNALEGKVPNADDFINAAILAGGLHGTVSVAGKLRKTFADTGVKPDEVSIRAQTDPQIQQDLLVIGDRVPGPIAKENGIPIGGELGDNSGGKPQALSATEGAKELPPQYEKLSDSEKKILSKVVDKQEKPKSESLTAAKAYEDFFDRLDPIKKAQEKLAQGKELPIDEDPYVLGRVANDAPALSAYMVEHGTVDFKTRANVGKSFDKIVSPHKTDPGFDAYLVAKKALEIESRGKNSGFDVEAAKDVVAKGQEKYDKSAQELVQYQNEVLKFGKDAGLLSEKQYQMFTEGNKAYLPYKRIFDPEEAGAAAKGGKLPGSFKELVGSERDIQNPFRSILENTQAIVKAAERNRAALELVKLAEKTPGQELLIPSEQRGKLRENQFSFYRDGKLEVWESPVPGVARALKALDGDPGAQNLFMKIARGFTTVKKIGTTFTPDFQVRNLFRDQLTSGVLSKEGTLPFVDVFYAMKDVVGKSDDYLRWQKSGGAGGMFMDFQRDVIDKRIFELNKETGFMDATWNVIKKPVDYMAAMGSLLEESTRLAEFKRTSKGATEGAKLLEGGYAAREITVDFSRMGAKLAAWNSMTAFMNVQVQGMDRLARAWKEDKVGTTMKGVAAITVPSVLLWWATHDDPRLKDVPDWQKYAFWLIPIDWWERVDNPALYEGMPDYLKRTTNGYLEVNKGPILRLPKPQEAGILLGSLVERTLDRFFTDNPHAYKGFDETMKNLVPSFIPDFISPVAEQWANKSLFQNSKIVPGYLEKLSPELQYSDYTSETAKALAKIIGYVPGTGVDKAGQLSVESPMVIDNYIRSWGGNLGQYATRLIDEALYKAHVVPEPVKPANTLADIPFVKAFIVRHPSAGAESIQEFYDNVAHQDMIMNDVKHIVKSGDLVAYTKETDKFMSGEEIIANFQKAKDALSTMSANIQKINQMPEKNPDGSPGFTRDEKRQLIDGYY